jgi:hypothetical protein
MTAIYDITDAYNPKSLKGAEDACAPLESEVRGG